MAENLFYMDGVVESAEDRGQSIVVKVKRENLRYPDTITFWENQTNIEVIRGIALKKGDRVRIVYTNSQNKTDAGNPYKDGVRVEPFGGIKDNREPPASTGSDEPHPAELEAPQQAAPKPTPQSAPSTQSNREDGMAYGAAQHAASRVLAAWYINHPEDHPSDADLLNMQNALTSLTDIIFRKRLPLNQ